MISKGSLLRFRQRWVHNSNSTARLPCKAPFPRVGPPKKTIKQRPVSAPATDFDVNESHLQGLNTIEIADLLKDARVSGEDRDFNREARRT